jgi:RimJ/RimL family protein N-acetyltransferase
MNELAFSVRRATTCDADTVIASINTVCAEHTAFYTTQFVPTAQWDQVLYWPERVPDHLLAVLERDGHFAGAGQLFPGSEATLFGHVAELGIWILQPYRRQGLGTMLLEWMLSWAVTANLEKVVLSLFATNNAALALYRKFGFFVEGRRQRQFKTNGQYIDEILMARFLDQTSHSDSLLSTKQL